MLSNITLSLLTQTGKNHAPLLSFSTALIKSSLYVRKSYFSKHFSSIIFSVSKNIALNQVIFDKFLSTPVRINEEVNKFQILSNQIIKNEKSITIDHCLFINCISNYCLDGGALSIRNFESHIEISKTKFINCSAVGIGGSLFIESQSCNIKFICFDESIARIHSQFFYIYSSYLNISDCTASKCSSQSDRYFSILRSNWYFSHSNISRNVHVESNFGIYLSSNIRSTLKYSSIENNTHGYNILSINNNAHTLISYCIFCGNDISSGSFIEVFNTDLKFYQCSFSANIYSSFLKLFNTDADVIFESCAFDFSFNDFEEFIHLFLKRNIFQTFRELPMHQKQFLECNQNSFDYHTQKNDIIDQNIPPSPTINLNPPGMIFIEYGLIVFAFIISPIIIMIYFISQRMVRYITFLSHHSP